MAQFFEIPLSTGAQSFSINLGGNQYEMRLIYRNAVGGGWFLDMRRADGSDAVLGVPLVTETDLLGQVEHKGFGHLLARLDSGAGGKPTYADMGTSLHLYWSAESWNQFSG